MELRIPGPVGALEAHLGLPEDGSAPRAAAIVCHPHPLHGGTMANTVVFRTARALRKAGVAALRFNFRGVEGSEGRHDGSGGPSGGETLDAAACLDWLAGEFAELPLWAAGFSFGARTVLDLARADARVQRVILVALPVRMFPVQGLQELRQPTLLCFAGEDEFGTAADLRGLGLTLPREVQVEEVPGADHLFRGKSAALEAKVLDYASRALAGPELPPDTTRSSGPTSGPTWRTSR